MKNPFLTKVLDYSFNGIYVYDVVKGCNIYINQAYTELTGYKLEDLNSMDQATFFALFHPEDQQAIADHMGEVMSANLNDRIEIKYRFKKKNGDWMWCHSIDSIIETDADEKPSQFMGAFIDITEDVAKAFKIE